MRVKHSPSKNTRVLHSPAHDLTTFYNDHDSTTSDPGITKRKRKQQETDNVKRVDFNDFRKEK